MIYPTLFCVARSGGDFSLKEVKHLARQVKHFSKGRLTLHCLSDLTNKDLWVEAEGPYPRFKLIPFKYDWPGRWAKLELFNPDLLRFGNIWYLDLDTIITGNIKPIATRLATTEQDEFIMLRDLHFPERAASGIMYLGHRVDRKAFWSRICNQIPKLIHNRVEDDDGKYIRKNFHPTELWQDVFPSTTYSFKPFRDGWLAKVPPKGKIVCFHGYPRPQVAARDFPWVEQHLYGKLPLMVSHEPSTDLPQYKEKHKGVLLVVGTGPSWKEDYEKAKIKFPKHKVALVGHAAKLLQGDFVFSDHYELLEVLQEDQSKFHNSFTTHSCMSPVWEEYPEVDYWWDIKRPEGSTVESAIRIGLIMGFDPLILCGCPLEKAPFQTEYYVTPDCHHWPPPRDIALYGKRMKKNTTEELEAMMQKSFRNNSIFWKGKVFSMSGFTKRILGGPE